jgi:cobalt-zinc-cadmium efflux system outer membrane protein
MEVKHKNMEELFERGIVSAALIIEAHRLMAEFAAEQNEQELKAIEALWSIYALQGKILEERL